MDEEMASASPKKQTLTLNTANAGYSDMPKRLRHVVRIRLTDVDLSELNYDPNNQNRFAIFTGLETSPEAAIRAQNTETEDEAIEQISLHHIREIIHSGILET
uniref:Uncharacterized protein n=1 Tax=Glossina palpalis gambiensis TaxID=67801 RepID=A0A1B0BYA4_9MUSC